MTLRPATDGDITRIHEILSEPGVERWWGQKTRAKCEELLREEGVDSFMVEVGEDAIGFIQCYEEQEEMYHHAGIDIALSDSWHGQGHGADAVRTLARHLIDDRGHHRLIIDPAADNHVAIRCYEKVGFRPVGIMRRYERGLDGTFHDGLLMDLLAEELPAP